MIATFDLPGRHHAARLVHELCRPDTAAVIAGLPARPGAVARIDVVQAKAALSIKAFWTAVRRLEAFGVVRRNADMIMVDHDHIDDLILGWVADSPLNPIMASHPGIGRFVQWGRVTRMPTEPKLINELYDALAELFDSGETLIESEVNARIAIVHDDPAEVRRALVDRGLLSREPGSAVYRRP